MSRIPLEERWGGITVHHPRYFMVPTLSAPFHGILMFVGVILLVQRLHSRLRFDCIDAHFVYPDGFAAVLIGKLLRIPAVVTAHGTDLNVYPRSLLLRPLIRWTLESADRVICVSIALKNVALSLKIQNDKIVVIPNGVDLNCFYPMDKMEARAILGMPLDVEVVLVVGQLISTKGHHLLIEAITDLRPKFPAVRLFIIGEGCLAKSLQRKVGVLGLDGYITLTGPVENEALFRWYSAADVTCQASSREGFPCVLLESLACGTPVVATEVGGTPELISSHDLGVLVKRDADSISAGLERVLSMDWNRTALVEYARSFTWEHNAVEIEEIFARSIKMNRTTPAEIGKTKQLMQLGRSL
jgi:teichuronic acid biosynthesis glycosyltransferase TuaC